VTEIFRWLNFSRHEGITLRVVAPPVVGLRARGLPDAVVLYRGFRDVIEGRLRLEREVVGWLRLGLALRADSGAVAPSHLNPAAVGSATFEPAVMAELRVRTWLQVTAGYALAVTPAVDTGPSVFDPTAAAACARAEGDLASSECAKRLAGAARPTAAGRYSAIQHTASLNATFRY
jgi:hypothetical protein